MSAVRVETGADVAESLWYSRSAPAAAARAMLSPLSLMFGAAVRLRCGLYDRGLVSSGVAPAPVISVGALRVGGAGKTPFVLWLVRELRLRGRQPCIVTRGYGGSASGAAPWLLDEAAARQPDAAGRAGDEAVLLALRSGAPVAIGADRGLACAAAASRLAGSANQPDVFVLDDGFQHRRLSRALDIVLVSGREAKERLLPAGPLREPVAALARAGVVVTMLEPDVALRRGPENAGAARSAAGGIEAFATVTGLVKSVADPDAENVSALEGRRVVAVAGIARPERFVAALGAAGADVVATILRRDHHLYGDDDRREIDAASAGADLVVTTEKDLVRLDGTALRAPLAALRIEIAFSSDAAAEALADRAARVAGGAADGSSVSIDERLGTI
jgi:tetraacyldisaccharide 4'-kinase